jgi:hypothetical protein
LGALAEILEAAARRARELDAEARAGRRDWIDQSTTALGRRRHCRIVRDRIARGVDGASIVGRRYLLSPDAHDEEIEALAERSAKVPKPESTSERIERRLSLVGGAR